MTLVYPSVVTLLSLLHWIYCHRLKPLWPLFTVTWLQCWSSPVGPHAPHHFHLVLALTLAHAHACAITLTYCSFTSSWFLSSPATALSASSPFLHPSPLSLDLILSFSLILILLPLLLPLLLLLVLLLSSLYLSSSHVLVICHPPPPPHHHHHHHHHYHVHHLHHTHHRHLITIIITLLKYPPVEFFTFYFCLKIKILWLLSGIFTKLCLFYLQLQSELPLKDGGKQSNWKCFKEIIMPVSFGKMVWVFGIFKELNGKLNKLVIEIIFGVFTSVWIRTGILRCLSWFFNGCPSEGS